MIEEGEADGSIFLRMDDWVRLIIPMLNSRLNDESAFPRWPVRMGHWTGRVSVAEGGGYTLGFPGVYATFTFTGGFLGCTTHAKNAFNAFHVSIDGGPSTLLRVPEGRAHLILAEGLTSGTHIVRIIRRNESWQGVVDIEAMITSAGGRLLPASEGSAASSARKLMFVGDSITAGAGIEEAPPELAGNHLESNAEASFGMELGRRLQAEVHLLGYGGRGLVRDYQGLNASQTLVAPVMFERALPDDAMSVWDHQRFTPDAVVVGLGTNDFSFGIPEQRTWIAAYDAFITRIREVHPLAWMILTNSPMFSVNQNAGNTARAATLVYYLEETVKLRRTAGDERVDLLQYRHQPGRPGNGHPTGPQHQQMADDLEPLLRSRLGWD